jgi:hypothetical protein
MARVVGGVVDQYADRTERIGDRRDGAPQGGNVRQIARDEQGLMPGLPQIFLKRLARFPRDIEKAGFGALFREGADNGFADARGPAGHQDGPPG